MLPGKVERAAFSGAIVAGGGPGAFVEDDVARSTRLLAALGDAE